MFGIYVSILSMFRVYVSIVSMSLGLDISMLGVCMPMVSMGVVVM